jgi:hypothetical protein
MSQSTGIRSVQSLVSCVDLKKKKPISCVSLVIVPALFCFIKYFGRPAIEYQYPDIIVWSEGPLNRTSRPFVICWGSVL